MWVKIIMVVSIVLTFCFGFVAIKEYFKSYSKKNNALNSNPKSLFPGTFFKEYFTEEQNVKLDEIENNIAMQVSRYEESSIIIADNMKKLQKAYFDALENCDENQFNEMSVMIDVCKATITLERDGFLIDNGSDANDFIMNRQNKFTDYLLTAVLIPILMEAINIKAKNFTDFATTVYGNRVLLIAICTFSIALSYRIFKYFHNKNSVCNSKSNAVLYNKAEMMLCCFERTFNFVEENRKKSI